MTFVMNIMMKYGEIQTWYYTIAKVLRTDTVRSRGVQALDREREGRGLALGIPQKYTPLPRSV